MKKQFKGFYLSIARYFRYYGGWSSLLSSPLFLFSLLVTFLSYDNWINPIWVSKSETLIPSLLGFSLGTYAILFSLMTGRLKNALKKAKRKDTDISYLDEINATFFHFIFVQVICLTWTILFNGISLLEICEWVGIEKSYVIDTHFWLRRIASFIGLFLVVYSIVLTLASALMVFRIASITDPNDG